MAIGIGWFRACASLCYEKWIKLCVGDLLNVIILSALMSPCRECFDRRSRVHILPKSAIESFARSRMARRIQSLRPRRRRPTGNSRPSGRQRCTSRQSVVTGKSTAMFVLIFVEHKSGLYKPKAEGNGKRMWIHMVAILHTRLWPGVRIIARKIK